MKEIKFSNPTPEFQNLVKKAKAVSADGIIDETEKNELIKTATKDHFVSRDERLFLKALENKDNVNKLKEGKINSLNFVLEINDKEPLTSYKKDDISEWQAPIPGTKIHNVGTKHNNIWNSPKTPQDLEDEILNTNVVKANPELKEKIVKFTSSLSIKDKEGRIYLKTLMEREPKLQPDKIGAILDKLTDMSKVHYDKRIGNRRDFIVSALHDVSAPSNISQQDVGTCAATVIQIQMAINKPVEYLNMLGKLAQNKSYTTVTGKKISTNWTFVRDNSQRTISSRLAQNAIMEFAKTPTNQEISQKHPKYNSKNPDTDGLESDQVERALNHIMNKKVASFGAIGSEEDSPLLSKKALMKKIISAKPSRENPIAIGISYSKVGRDSLHEVNVININHEKNNVTIINPWGREEVIPLKQLEKRLNDISIPIGNYLNKK